MYAANCDRITSLHRFAQRRRYFDPSSRDDLMELKYFKKNNKWKAGCPFYLESPYNDTITMCESKYSEYMIMKLK